MQPNPTQNAYRTIEQTQIAKAMARMHGHLLAIFWGFVITACSAFWFAMAPRPANQYAVLEYLAAKALSWLTLLPQPSEYPRTALQRFATWFAALPQPQAAQFVAHILTLCAIAGLIGSFIFLIIRLLILDALREKSKPKLRMPAPKD